MAEATSVSSIAHSESTSGLHTLAAISVVAGLAGVLTGAMVTSSGGTQFVQLHEVAAATDGILIAVLGAWLIARRISAGLGGALLALMIADGAVGFVPESPTVGSLHALLAQVLFAATTAALVVTGAAWQEPPDLVEDHGWPSLGGLGKITPVLVFCQVAMGAAFRHKAMSVLPHLFGAMILVLVILCVCIFIMQQFPEHKALRPAANLLMTIAFAQIFLGIAAFTVRTMTTKVTPVVIGVTAVHACVGAMTLASAVVVSMQIRRNVFKKKAEAEEEE